MVDLTDIFGPNGFDVFESQQTLAAEYKDQADKMIKDIIKELKDAEFKNKTIQSFLIYAFSKVLEGNNADKTFLRKGDGRGKKKRNLSDIEREFDIARDVYHMLQTKVPGKTKNRLRKIKNDECFAIMAKKYRLSAHTIQDIYKLHKKFVIEELEQKNSGY